MLLRIVIFALVGCGDPREPGPEDTLAPHETATPEETGQPGETGEHAETGETGGWGDTREPLDSDDSGDPLPDTGEWAGWPGAGTGMCLDTHDEADLSLASWWVVEHSWVVELGDLSGDGIADLFTATNYWDPDRQDIHYYQGPLVGGSPTLTTTITHDIGYDADGYFGLAIIEPGVLAFSDIEYYPIPGSQLSLYDQVPSAGSFGAARARVQAAYSWYGLFMIAVGDADGDGQGDLIVYDYRERSHWFLPGDVVGSVSRDEVSWELGSFDQTISPGDVDGDGVAELLLTPDDDDAAVLLRGPTDQWLPVEDIGGDAVQLAKPGWDFDSSVAGGDFNGDGYDDIAVGGYGETVASWEGWVVLGPVSDADLDHAEAHLTGFYGGGFDLDSAGDPNDDGRDDLVLVDDDAILLFGPFEGEIELEEYQICDEDAWHTSAWGTTSTRSVEIDGDGVDDLVLYRSGSEDEDNGSFVFLGPLFP